MTDRKRCWPYRRAAGTAGTGARPRPLVPGSRPRRGAIEVVTLPSANSPLVSIRLQFDAGSIHDPGGQGGARRPDRPDDRPGRHPEALLQRPARGPLPDGGRDRHQHRPRGDAVLRHGPPRQARRVHGAPRGGAAAARRSPRATSSATRSSSSPSSPTPCAATTRCSAWRCSSRRALRGPPLRPLRRRARSPASRASRWTTSRSSTRSTTPRRT